MNTQQVIDKIQAYSDQYWQKRFSSMDEDREKRIQDTVDGFIYLFDLATNHIIANLASFFARFAGEDGYIEYADLNRFSTGDEKRKYRAELYDMADRIIAEGYEIDIDTQALLDRLDSRFRTTRLQIIDIYNRLELEFLFAIITNRYFRHNAEVMKDFYYGTIYEVFFAAGYGDKKLNKLSDKRIEERLKESWRPTSEDFVELLFRYKRMLHFDVRKVVEQVSRSGYTLPDAEELVRKAFKSTLRNLKVQLASDSTFYSTLGQEDAFIELGIEEALFCAVLDERTTEMCRAANGDIIAVDDIQPWINSPPLHYGCRSTLIPIVTKLDYLTGKTYSMEDYSKDTWYEKFL